MVVINMAFKYTFQHYVDISTSATSPTIIKISAGGQYAAMRCRHLLGAYKYAKLGKISIKLIPASTLPVDPLGLSYADDDPQTVDPRDQLNPGLVRITNGEDIYDDLSGLSDEALEQMYINTMLDPRWSKFMLQSGFKRSAVPLYWTVGQLAQDVYPGSVTNVPQVYGTETLTTAVRDTSTRHLFDTTLSPSVGSSYSQNFAPAYWDRSQTDPRGLFQTGHKGRLGWMPTDAWQGFYSSAGSSVNQAMMQPLLCPQVITAILPKAHKTLYYYRMFITETIYFSGIKNYGVGVGVDATGDTREYRAFDNFTSVDFPHPDAPSTYDLLPSQGAGLPATKNDGGIDNWMVQ